MLLLSTSSLSGYGLHRIFSFAKKAKYDGIDLVLTPKDFDNWDEDYVKSLSDEFALPVLSIRAPHRDLNEKKVDKIVSLAIKLKSQNITFFPPYITDKNTTWYTKYLTKVKKDKNISISIANVEAKFIFFIIPEYKNASLMDIKKITGDTALDISKIDSSTSVDIMKAQKALGNSLKNIYVSDINGPAKGLMPGNAGGGTSYLPLESFLMKLRVSGYGAFITLDVNNKELGVGNEEKVLFNLEYFKKYYEKHFLDIKQTDTKF
ncbi:MAG: hypothetical protein PHH06_00255 [Candidatus Gracilibacteria bacterium]|nr:hypothetical protein [Candidatus Gracilibacteria bacterium]